MDEEDDFEPDSPESILTDKFIKALMFGDGPLAALAARELKELDGMALESLASVFDDGWDYLFPFRLEFRNRRRGKPKHEPSSHDLSTPEKKLINAIKRRNRAATGAAVRDMKQLRGEALELVIKLLDNSSKLGQSIPCRLLFVYRRRGRPHHPLTSGARSLGRSFLFERAKAEIIQSGKKPKKEAAIADVMEKTGLCRATVFKSLRKAA
jgi:hypothetical protein